MSTRICKEVRKRRKSRGKKKLRTNRVKWHKCPCWFNFPTRRRSSNRKRKVVLFGFNGKRTVPLLTSKEGMLRTEVSVAPSSRIFHEESYLNITVQSEWTYLPPQDTAVQVTYSYAIINRSPSAVIAQVEISPDGERYTADREVTVAPEGMAVIVPTKFLKFTRIALRTAQSGNEAALVDVFFQTQSAS